MGGKGALNSLPIVPKAFVYVPTVILIPVMGGNTMSETFTYMFHAHFSIPQVLELVRVPYFISLDETF